MKKSKPIAAVLSAIILSSCGSNSEEKQIPEAPVDSVETIDGTKVEHKEDVPKPKKETHVQITNTEDKLINQIWHLPEVRTCQIKLNASRKENAIWLAVFHLNHLMTRNTMAFLFQKTTEKPLQPISNSGFILITQSTIMMW